ncbi:MAG: gliding motility-associated C-terminal domain-containing protein [Elusimicrobia bacterium]|nr:gliding motility-associated C-terminal domain-containing protein [Elusimicrobiota bacterium]
MKNDATLKLKIIKSKNFLLFVFLLTHLLTYSLTHRLFAADVSSPAAISDLTALTGDNEGEVILTWTAPGDDALLGTVSGYFLKYAEVPIRKDPDFSNPGYFTYPQSLSGFASGGNLETRTLTALTSYSGKKLYFAMKGFDESNNYGIWTSSIDVAGINPDNSCTVKLILPSAVNDLSVVAGYKQATLTWTSPGDDSNSYNIVGGTFAIRYSDTGPINESNWNAAPYSIVIPTSTTAGAPQKYTITGLTNGITYYFAIKTRDENETGWSAVDTTSPEPSGMSFNNPPLSFSLLSPASGYISLTAKPSFDWEDTTDPDVGGSIAEYSLEYSLFSDFSYSSEKSTTSSAYTFVEPLTDDKTYYWRAKAIDVDGGIARTSSRIIYINTSNLPPTTFYLLTPADGSVVLKRPSLSWETSLDPDPPGVIEYTIYYSSYSDFSIYQTTSGLTSPNYTFTSNLAENATYYWKVAAIDEYTTPATVFSEKSFSFYVKPVLPASPSNVKITNGIISWSPVSFDEDGAVIVDLSAYNIYRSSDIKIIGSTETYAGYTTATSTLATSGFWTVIRAVDLFGNESANSVAVKPDETKQILISNDKEVIIELPLAAQSSISNSIISISKSGNIYEIKVFNSSTMAEISGFTFSSPVKITFESAGDCVYWYNEVEYVALGGKNGNSITVETTKLGKFYVGLIAATKLKLASSFPTKIFTPNDDGINDEINLTFTGVTEDLTDAEIFDITGKKIADMTQNDYSWFSWDGKNSDGKMVLPGVYIYQVKSGKNICNGTVVVAR